MHKAEQFLGIIPARYASTRLPGKPLALIGDKPMIQHVYENCRRTLSQLYVATDDARVFDAVSAFGGNVVMTSDKHRNGTERCEEAARLIRTREKIEFDVVINIQGDEPFLDIQQIEDIKNCFVSPDVQIATLIQKVNDVSSLFDENEAKVVINNNFEAVYFSRSPIPFVRNAEKNSWTQRHVFYRHIGIYAYRVAVLSKLVKLQPAPLEKAESLEQLRWIENGYKIKCGLTQRKGTVCVDTPEDLKKANAFYKTLKK